MSGMYCDECGYNRLIGECECNGVVRLQTIEFKSEGFDKAYIKELEERLRLSALFAYGNLIGWALTVILFVYLK